MCNHACAQNGGVCHLMRLDIVSPFRFNSMLWKLIIIILKSRKIRNRYFGAAVVMKWRQMAFTMHCSTSLHVKLILSHKSVVARQFDNS